MSETKDVGMIVQALQPYADKGLIDLESFLSQTLQVLEVMEGNPACCEEVHIRHSANFQGDEVCVRISHLEIQRIGSIADADRLVEAKMDKVRAKLRAAMEPILASAFERVLK